MEEDVEDIMKLQRELFMTPYDVTKLQPAFKASRMLTAVAARFCHQAAACDHGRSHVYRGGDMELSVI